MSRVPRLKSHALAVAKTMIRGNRGALLLAVLLTALGNFLQASSLVSLAPIIDLFIHPDPAQASGITRFISHFLTRIGQPTSFLTVTAVFLAIVIVKNVVLYFAQYSVSRLHFRLIQHTILDGFRAMMSARWPFFVSKNYGLLGNTFVRESDKVGLAFEAVAAMVSKILEISSYLALSVIISWQLTLLVLLLIVLCVLPFALFGKLTRQAGKIHTDTANRFQGIILETLNAAKLVLGYGNQQKSVDVLEQIVPSHVHAALQFVMVRVLTPLLFEPIGMVITLTAVYFGYYHYHIEVSLLFIMLYAFRMCALRAVEFIDQTNVLDHMSPALEQINALRNEAALMAESTGTHPFHSLEQGITLSGATFVHENGTTVLRDVTLSVPKGTMVAIVGKSGAGKTTLLDIIMGFYDLQVGQYAIDGMPFRDIDLLSWRQKIGFVPQDPFLFNRSIRENLLWGNEHATNRDCEHACRLANAHEFIMALPNQYDTIVGERGVMLSGGERQRVALARALVRHPELLILDEATSSLDSDSERLIQQSIEQVARLSTIIVVAHRLSTIRAADRIYVLDQGRIIEEGSFTELMAKTGGAFLKAAELQGIAGLL